MNFDKTVLPMVKNETSRQSFYQVADDQRYGSDREEEKAPLLNWIGRFKPPFVLEIGCGLHSFHDVHPCWIGLDISLYALTHNPRTRCMCGDWGIGLPIHSESVPFVVSIFTLEHVPSPEAAFEELDRILAPNGIAYLKPAFNVPTWRANGLEYVDYDSLSLSQSLAKRTIFLRRRPVWRFLTGLVWGRLFDEVQLFLAKRHKIALPLRWKRLLPYPEGYIGPDSDAICAMDKSAVAVWFLSRGYKVLAGCGARTLPERIFADHSALVVKKSASNSCK
jgi:SAM-dependent methyltransferase